jgi:hypothetical protein
MPIRDHRPTADTSRFEGFKGAFDRIAGAFVFESPEERDRYQRAKHGAVRNGFRFEWEQTDERPLLIYSEPFFESSDEQAAWLRAVQSCPLAEYGSLDLFAYLAEVGKVAVGLPGGMPTMPRTRLTRRQMDERVRALRAQAKL